MVQSTVTRAKIQLIVTYTRMSFHVCDDKVKNVYLKKTEP